MLDQPDKYPGVWDVVSGICGVIYFTAWSISFYPQPILNYKRKSAIGLSADFTWINPLGFLALTLWSWGVYFSPIARDQYRRRHDGHEPQISIADLAFSLHALLASLFQLFQVYYYTFFYSRLRPSWSSSEEDPLLPPRIPLPHERMVAEPIVSTQPTRPSVWFQLIMAACWIMAFGGAVLVWTGKQEFLDWLYLLSSLKLLISSVKFVPQVLLNWRLQSSEGFAVTMPILDFTGGLFSFLQLVISSVFIERDPGGIIANPAKLGLSFLSVLFDTIFILQKFYFYRHAADPAKLPTGALDEDDD